MAKSPNLHNRLWGKMEPLGEELVRAIEGKNYYFTKKFISVDFLEKQYPSYSLVNI